MWSVTLYDEIVSASTAKKLIKLINDVFKAHNHTEINLADWYNLSQIRKLGIDETVILKLYGQRILSTHQAIEKIEKLRHRTIEIGDKKETIVLGPSKPKNAVTQEKKHTVEIDHVMKKIIVTN